jgi:hypothetical protein
MTHGSGPSRLYGRGAPTDEYPQQSLVVAGKPPRPRRRRRGFQLFAVAVTLLAAVLVATYVLAGQSAERGANSPDQAVEGFLTNIFDAHDATAAGTFVCASARNDDELSRTVLQAIVQEQGYTGAQTTWSYPPIRTEGRRAAADVALTMTTANEQVASKSITVLLVDDNGWWVCDIRTV